MTAVIATLRIERSRHDRHLELTSANLTGLPRRSQLVNGFQLQLYAVSLDKSEGTVPFSSYLAHRMARVLNSVTRIDGGGARVAPNICAVPPGLWHHLGAVRSDSFLRARVSVWRGPKDVAFSLASGGSDCPAGSQCRHCTQLERPFNSETGACASFSSALP